MASQVQIISGAAMGTYKLTASDNNKQSIADGKKYQNGDTEGRKARAAFITVETYALRYTVGNTSPTVAGIGHILQPGGGL